MSDYYVLDACALSAYLNDEAGADVVEDCCENLIIRSPICSCTG